MKSYSWEVINDDIAVKQTDKSVFKHHGTGIPKNIKIFWNVNDLGCGERADIILIYKKVPYKAYIVIDLRKRARMYWYSDLSKVIANEYRVGDLTQLPQMHFARKGLNEYDLKFVGMNSFYQQEINETVEIIETKEGQKKLYYVTHYERDSKNREKAISIHGLKCNVCGFDFEETYGEIGEGYIEVHHHKPLSTLEGEEIVDPEQDLITVCSNCHRMLHRKRDKITTIDELKKIIKK